jgi:hypothetical protein
MMSGSGDWETDKPEPGESRPISEARRKASDTVAYLLSMDFDPVRLNPYGQAIYLEWVSESTLNVHMAAMLFGTARLSIKAGRLAGLSEPDIRHDFMGRVHDNADANSVPSKRATSAPRDDFMTITKAIFELATTFHDDQDWEELVQSIEASLEHE